MASFNWLNSAFGFQQYHSSYKSRDYILEEKQTERSGYCLLRSKAIAIQKVDGKALAQA